MVHLEDGVLLRFEYFDGEHPRPSPERRRFYLDLSLTAKLRALNTIFEALAEVVNAGWIMVDFYEGNVLYNFRTGEVKIFDFEFFERAGEAGGFVLRRERNPGSTRLMAPEAWVRGERIDQATNVYTLGRFAINAMCADVGDDWRPTFQGSDRQATVIERATRRDREKRYRTVEQFVAEFALA